MEHKKHKHHPHDKVSAMPQFNEPHWQKKIEDVEMVDTRYSSEMNQCAEYKKMVDKQNQYAKSHKAEH